MFEIYRGPAYGVICLDTTGAVCDRPETLPAVCVDENILFSNHTSVRLLHRLPVSVGAQQAVLPLPAQHDVVLGRFPACTSTRTTLEAVDDLQP